MIWRWYESFYFILLVFVDLQPVFLSFFYWYSDQGECLQKNAHFHSYMKWYTVCLWNKNYLISSSLTDSLLVWIFMLFLFISIFVAGIFLAVLQEVVSLYDCEKLLIFIQFIDWFFPCLDLYVVSSHLNVCSLYVIGCFIRMITLYIC